VETLLVFHREGRVMSVSGEEEGGRGWTYRSSKKFISLSMAKWKK